MLFKLISGKKLICGASTLLKCLPVMAHIGVSVRNINLHNGGITSVDEPTRRVPSKHKRYDRVIISDRKAREHLKYISMKVLNKLKEPDILHPEEEQAGKHSLNAICLQQI